MRVMDQLEVDIGFLVKMKLTEGIYSHYSSNYSVLALTATSVRQGGTALFWRGNNSYEVEETQIWGANIISLQLMMGAVQFFVVGCCIPPSDLETLTDVNKAWRVCPAGVHPILVGNLNFNFCAPCMEREEMIAKQVDAMDLVDMSRHFCQCLGKQLQWRWTWGIRRVGRWISLQCNYFFGRETDWQRFRCVSVRMPCYYSNHHVLVAVIYSEGGGGDFKRYQQQAQRFPISLPMQPPKRCLTLNMRSCSGTWYTPPCGSTQTTEGSPPRRGNLLIIAHCCVGRECSPKQQCAALAGK